jgi:hypothetical protein
MNTPYRVTRRVVLTGVPLLALVGLWPTGVGAQGGADWPAVEQALGKPGQLQHSHGLHEEPRLFYLHFWGKDDGPALARGLRAALDRTNSQRP